MPGMVRFSSLENLLCQVEIFGLSHTCLCQRSSLLKQQASPLAFGLQSLWGVKPGPCAPEARLVCLTLAP
jgi:hypothetical protein